MGANTSDADLLQGLGRGRGRGISLLVKQNPNDAGSVVWSDFFFDEVVSGGITGTASTSQAQTIGASGSFALSAVSGAIATSQAQTLSAAGSFVPLAVSGTAATSQAQSAAVTGSFATSGVSGAVATSQAQTVSGSGTTAPQSVSGIGSTSQAQRIAGTGAASPQAVTGTATTRQAQTVVSNGTASPQAISGVSVTSQVQTVAGNGDFVGISGVTGASSTAQAQTSNGVGSVVNPVQESIQPVGGFIPVEVKRSKPKKLRDFEDVEPEIIELIEKKAEIAVQPKRRIASESQMRSYMTNAGIPYQSTHRQIYLELVQEMRKQAQEEEDEAIATLIAMLI